jgi:hypothetical protein
MSILQLSTENARNGGIFGGIPGYLEGMREGWPPPSRQNPHPPHPFFVYPIETASAKLKGAS